MAEEPQPPTVREGADPPDALPANAEDRKAAQAMSSLDVKTDEDDSSAPKKEVDTKALAEAMKYLSVGESAGKKDAGAAKKKEVEAPAKPLVKVDAADVALVVEQCDLSKAKATELLRAYGADVERAMRGWVVAGV